MLYTQITILTIPHTMYRYTPHYVSMAHFTIYPTLYTTTTILTIPHSTHYIKMLHLIIHDVILNYASMWQCICLIPNRVSMLMPHCLLALESINFLPIRTQISFRRDTKISIIATNNICESRPNESILIIVSLARGTRYCI